MSCPSEILVAKKIDIFSQFADSFGDLVFAFFLPQFDPRSDPVRAGGPEMKIQPGSFSSQPIVVGSHNTGAWGEGAGSTGRGPAPTDPTSSTLRRRCRPAAAAAPGCPPPGPPGAADPPAVGRAGRHMRAAKGSGGGGGLHHGAG